MIIIMVIVKHVAIGFHFISNEPGLEISLVIPYSATSLCFVDRVWNGIIEKWVTLYNNCTLLIIS